MNQVLYTPDFEPITVIDLPVDILEHIDLVGSVRIGISRSESIDKNNTDEYIDSIVIKQVKLYWHDNTVKSVLTTEDEILALTIRPGILPGQRLQIQNYETAIGWLAKQLKKQVKKNNLDDTL